MGVVTKKAKEEGDLHGGSVHLITCGNFTAEKLRPVVIELSDGNWRVEERLLVGRVTGGA